MTNLRLGKQILSTLMLSGILLVVLDVAVKIDVFVFNLQFHVIISM